MQTRALVLRDGGQPLLKRCLGRDAEVRACITQLSEWRPGERGRQASRQIVVSYPERRQGGQVAEPVRQAARETVRLKVHGGHAARRIDVHPVPLGDRTVSKPSLAVRPASPARRFVQRPQHLRIGADRTLAVFNPLVPRDQLRRKAEPRVLIEPEQLQLREFHEA